MGLYTELKKAGLLGSVRKPEEMTQLQAGTVLGRFLVNNVKAPQSEPPAQTTQLQAAKALAPPISVPRLPSLAELNKVSQEDLSPQTRIKQAREKVIADMAAARKPTGITLPKLATGAGSAPASSGGDASGATGTQPLQFLPNLAPAEAAKWMPAVLPVAGKSTPGVLLPMQGAIEGFANIPANMAKAGQLTAHGIGSLAPAAIKGVQRDYRSLPEVAAAPTIESVRTAWQNEQREKLLREALSKLDGVAASKSLPGTGTAIPSGDIARRSIERGIDAEREAIGTPDMTNLSARAAYAVGGLLPNLLEWMSPTAAVSAPLAVAGRTGIEAEQAGATMDEQFVNAAAAGALAAALQRFGVSGEGKKLAAMATSQVPVAKSAILSGLKAIAKAGGEEALESVAETIVGNAVAKGTYDPTRTVADAGELLEEAGMGFMLGGLAGAPRATISAAAAQLPDAQGMPYYADAKQMHASVKGKVRTFDRMVSDVVNDLGLSGVVRGGAKSAKSIANKVARKADEQYTVESMKDHVRASVLVNDLAEVPAVIEALRQRGEFSGEAFLTEPLNNTGYRGIHLTVSMGDGVNGEIQIHTPEAWAIKKQTDKIYDKWRNTPPTKESWAEYQADMDESRQLWDSYFGGITEEVMRMASDSVMGLASINRSNVPLMGDQVPSENSKGMVEDSKSSLPSSEIENEERIQSPPTQSIPQPGENDARAAPGDSDKAGRWKTEEIEQMADGTMPIPADIESLQTLADEIEALSEKGPKGVTFDLQRFASEVSERLNVNLVEQHRRVKELKKLADKAYADAPLTEYDDYILQRVKSGATLRNMMPGDANITAIESVLQAEDAYKEARQILIDHNTKRKAKLFEQMGDLVDESNDWKDIKAGIVLAADTMERNMIRIAGELDGRRINETLFRPVHENEAKGTRWLNKMRQPVRDLKLSKVESEIVQLVGEKKADPLDIEPGKPLRYEDSDGRQRFVIVPENTTKERIEAAVSTFRNLYDTMISQVNDVLAQNGYEPVEYRKDYFPHFEEATDPMNKALKLLGIDIESIELPTDISGLTHTFRPGRKWFQFAQQRQGNKTAYDALEGFDRYTQGIKDVVWHTFDIQRLRAFEAALRAKHSGAGYEAAVKTIINDASRPWEERQKDLDDMLTRKEATTKHSALAGDIRQYTDNLAGKKSLHDRPLEADGGRSAIYNVLRNVQQRVARNMVVLNPASWATNFISLAQGAAFIDSKNVLAATTDTIRAYAEDDGFAQQSTFLTNRRGADPLSRNFWEATTDKLAAPMRIIDDITANILVRGKYKEGIAEGLSHKEAMRMADAFTAGAMADRSKGSLPTLFNRQNLFSKLLTQFQLEVNNQYRFLFKDMPREAKVKGGLWFAQGFLKMMLASYLYNELYEKLVGRRPAFDPIGIAVQAIESKDNPNLMITNATDEIKNQVPFIGSVMGGGRLPIQAAFPTGDGLRSAREKFIDGDTIGAVKTLGKELSGPAAYLLPPVGGGQIKKTVEGVTAFARGESQTASGGMRYPIPQTLGNLAKTAVFGQYATKEAREYFDEARRPLSESQAERVRTAKDPKAEYETIMAERDVDRAKAALKKAIKEKENEAKIKALERRQREALEELAKAKK